MAKYDASRYGTTSKDRPATQALREAWEAADRMNADLPEGTAWRLVPKTAVFIDESILPREGGVDPKLVDHYADIWHDLPPITVQKGSFKLIDGAHPFGAAFETQAGTDHVKIIELDIRDDDLLEQAYRANVQHGRALTLSEKRKFAVLLIRGIRRCRRWTSPGQQGSTGQRRRGIATAPSAGRRRSRCSEAARRSNARQAIDGDRRNVLHTDQHRSDASPFMNPLSPEPPSLRHWLPFAPLQRSASPPAG